MSRAPPAPLLPVRVRRVVAETPSSALGRGLSLSSVVTIGCEKTHDYVVQYFLHAPDFTRCLVLVLPLL